MSPRKRKPRFYIFLLALIAAVGLYVFMGIDRDAHNEAARAQEQQNEQMASDNAEKQRKIKFAATDEYVEQQARDQNLWAKEGETVYALTDN